MALNFVRMNSIFTRSRQVDEGISRLIDETTAITWSGAYNGNLNGTFFVFPTGLTTDGETADEESIKMEMTRDGIIRNFRGTLIAVDGNETMTIRKNGVDTNLSISFTVDGTVENLINEVFVIPGDKISLRLANVDGINEKAKWGMEFKQF